MGERYFFFLEIIVAMEPLIWEKMFPQNRLFDFHSAGMGFFEETLFPMEMVIFVFVVRHQFQEKCSCPPKLFFAIILENTVVFSFFEKIVI